jgi:hypothetical protein
MSVADSVPVTTRKVQRRHAERSLDALWDRILKIPEPTDGDRSAFQALAKRYIQLCLMPEAMRDHTWDGDWDSLELRVRRAEVAR